MSVCCFRCNVCTYLLCLVSLTGLAYGGTPFLDDPESRHGLDCTASHLVQKDFRIDAVLNNAMHRTQVREAVIFVTKWLNSLCLFGRLLALVESASSTHHPRHVWLLHNKSHPPEDAPMTSELLAAGLRTAPQPDAPAAWDSFAGGFHSGNSKPAFLAFALAHSEYEFFWHLEDDVFYTGRWHVLFDSVWKSRNSSADLVSDFRRADKHWHWFHHCRVLGDPCHSKHRSKLMSLWPAARYSRRFASELADSLSTANSTYGHHEAVTASFCAASAWCSMVKLQRRGVFETAGWGPFRNKSNQSLEKTSALYPPHHVEMDRVYHPVKCQASATLGDAALQYVRQNGSTDDMPT